MVNKSKPKSLKRLQAVMRLFNSFSNVASSVDVPLRVDTRPHVTDALRAVRILLARQLKCDSASASARFGEG